MYMTLVRILDSRVGRTAQLFVTNNYFEKPSMDHSSG